MSLRLSKPMSYIYKALKALYVILFTLLFLGIYVQYYTSKREYLSLEKAYNDKSYMKRYKTIDQIYKMRVYNAENNFNHYESSFYLMVSIGFTFGVKFYVKSRMKSKI